jgi:hypothetical protein
MKLTVDSLQLTVAPPLPPPTGVGGAIHNTNYSIHTKHLTSLCKKVDNSNLLEKIATHVYNSPFKNYLSTSYTHFVFLYNLLKNKEVIDFEQRLYSYPQPLMLLLNFFKKRKF